MKKLAKSFTIIFSLLAVACNLSFTPNTYYYLQQNQSVDEENTSGVPPAEDISVRFGVMFDILEPNGIINQDELESYLKKNKIVLESNPELVKEFYNQLQELPVIKKESDSSYPLGNFTTSDFSSLLLIAKFSDKNVPEMWYESATSETVWALSEDKTFLEPIEGEENAHVFSYVGENTTAGVNAITDVTYFKYESKNPFYAINSSYNTDTFTKSENGVEEIGMNRFIFYRFNGKGGGIVNLDNMLVAVDTYTSLVFSFGVPTEFLSVLGQDSPTKWEAVEVAASAPNGQKYKFYEYDPAGFVNEEGVFIMYDWYIDNLSKANATNQTNFYPRFTGISPYLVNFDVKKPEFSIINNQRDENGYYTEITGCVFTEAPKEVISYDIYRIDDSHADRKRIATLSDSNTSYKDYNALILSQSPQYVVEAKDIDGNLIGATSDVKEGKRKLTNREILLATIETIRYALIDQGAHGSINPTKILSDDKGGTFIYKKTGLFTATYTYTLENFEPYFISASTVAEGGVNLSYESKNLFTSIITSKDFIGTVLIDGEYKGILAFNNIKITNNDKENPAWSTGTLDYTIDTVLKSYGPGDTIPFGFYMSKETFVNAIIGEKEIYIQE